MSRPGRNAPDDDALRAVLEQARTHGAFGPGPIAGHLTHAQGFVTVAERVLGRAPTRAVDLGPGGGVPGLVLAAAWPDAEVVLVEASRRRVRDLERAVTDLFGPSAHVTVLEARAEEIAHDPGYRETADLVTARSFAQPAITAEVGAGFVASGGWLVVSEPPDGTADRWPASGLTALGLGPAELIEGDGAKYVAIPKSGPAPAEVPRPTRQLVKRPRW